MSTLNKAENSPQAFVTFIKQATENQKSPQYAELQQFLLEAFSQADHDFDGKIGPLEFESMVDIAASLPRRWGFAPTDSELYITPEQKAKDRKEFFSRIDTDGSGFISFDEWLKHIYPHICEKAKTLRADAGISKMENSKEDFKQWVVAAARSRHSLQYKELYNFLLQCFTEADTDHDGRIDATTFDKLIDIAASAPRRFGFAPQASTMYKDAAERMNMRKMMFEKMDTDRSGFISFEEWLTFSYTHICDKAATLDSSAFDSHPASAQPSQRSAKTPTAPSCVSCYQGMMPCFAGLTEKTTVPVDGSVLEEAKKSPEAFVNFLKGAAKSKYTKEYAALYNFLLRCFTNADRDFDGKITPRDFDTMIDVAAKFPRRFGFAPGVAELFASPQEKLIGRSKLFRSIDADGSGFISFDEWLQYIYPHICEKTAQLEHRSTTSATLRSKEDFRKWVVAAMQSKQSTEFKELYRLLLECFTKADTDHDGLIDAASFDALIDIAAEAPRRWGYAPSASALFKNPEERMAARKAMFDNMDTDKSGFISFEEWLTFSYKHICEKAVSLLESSEQLSMEAAAESKVNFVTFIKRATEDRSSPEYHELYCFLLKCFTEADADFDGKIRPFEFDAMVEAAAALPRTFGFAPTASEIFQSASARALSRAQLFKSIDSEGTGFISFDKWLNYVYPHICDKASLLKVNDLKDGMNTSRENFRDFILNATKSRQSMEYKELYSFLLQCFSEADTDHDGRIRADAFDRLVDVAAQAPRRFGFAPPSFVTYTSVEHRVAARRAMFKEMDTDGGGFISFEEWLTFAYKHICEKAQTLVASDSQLRPLTTYSGSGPQLMVPLPVPVPQSSRLAKKITGYQAARDSREGFVKFLAGATRGQDTPEYVELYHVLLKCFTDADTDFDGKVRVVEFDMMVDAAATLPRRFGFAPSTAEMFKTSEEKLRARAAMFSKIDSDGSGFISFDKWIEYIYPHICEKTKQIDTKSVTSRMERSKQDFQEWVVAACRSRHSMEYKELYNFLLHCFTEADTDCDGRIDANTFDALIDVAAKAPRKFGFAPPASTTYKTTEERNSARKQMFEQMDTDKSSFISFEEWLRFSYTHICEKAETLDGSLSGVLPAN